MRRALLIAAVACAASDAQPCNPATIVIGDSRSANRLDGQLYWPSQVTKVYAADFAVSGYVWSQCLAAYATALSSLVPMHGSTTVQCGVNDIINNGNNGHDIFTTEKTWVEANASNSNVIYWMNIPGFKGAYPTQSLLDARNAFNSDFATYCLSPARNVRCIDIATPLQDPNDHDALLAANTLDGIHYTTAGHTIVKNTFQSVFPRIAPPRRPLRSAHWHLPHHRHRAKRAA